MMLGHDVAQHTGVVQPEGEEKVFFMPGTDGNMGRLAAYRTATMEPVWSFQQRSPFLTGVLSTDGNVSFVGDYDRVFRAVETTTGNTLWTVRLPTVVQGNPVAFAVDGKQYVAITTGLGGGSPFSKPSSRPGEICPAAAASILRACSRLAFSVPSITLRKGMVSAARTRPSKPKTG